jgi:phosphoglycerate dehydrogenase-like enzyme
MSETAMKKETLILVSYATQNPERQRDLRDGVARVLNGRDFALHFPADEAAACKVLGDAEILLGWSLTEPLFRAAPRLKWVHLGNAGVERSLFPAVIESKVVMTNASGIHGPFMSEWALAALLYLAQAFSEADAWRHDRQWRSHKDAITPKRFLIEGLRALIVGYGSVGQVVAQKFTALGVRCEGVTTTARKAKIPLHPLTALESIVADYDVVVLALPDTPTTRHLFSRDLLQRMKSGSLFINVGRGKTVDEVALVEALRHGPLGGAALDVFATEPLPEDSPLFELPNVFMAPHVSGNFPAYTHAVIAGFLRNLAHYIADEPLENLVDKRRGY